jgi:hexokinase
LAAFLKEHLDKEASALGINFAFPLNPIIGSNNQLDGILIGGTKEHTFDGLIGQSISDFVSGIFFEKFGKRIPVTVANDSICLTLSGSGTEDAGLIVGTGINLSLKMVQKNKNILNKSGSTSRHSGLLASLRSGSRISNGSYPGAASSTALSSLPKGQYDNEIKYIANLELGNFDGFTPTETLRTIDQYSEHPGTYLFEKSISGRYLVVYYNEEVKLRKFNLPHLDSSIELSRLAEKSLGPDGDLARSILARSASLIACALAGAYEFKNSLSKFEIITEGSLFWKGYKYLENVNRQLALLGVPENTISFKYIEDSSLKGALGLLTK